MDGEAPVALAADSTLFPPDSSSLEALEAWALAHREELHQADGGIRLSTASRRAAGSRTTQVVASVIPLGIVGGVVVLLGSGDTLSFIAMIGFVALVGIEIKASMRLVDFTASLRRDGMPLDDAIQKAGEVRFQPIVLTTMTAIRGLLPLACKARAVLTAHLDDHRRVGVEHADRAAGDAGVVRAARAEAGGGGGAGEGGGAAGLMTA